MRNCLLFLLLMLLMALAAYSQNNASKASFFPESRWRMIGFAQERAVAKRMSLQATLKCMPQTQVAEARYAARSFTDPVTGINPFSNTRVSSLGAVAEWRIYGKKRGALHGFYWGPYLGAGAYNISTGVYNAAFRLDYNHIYTGQMQGDCRVRTISGGLQIGLQTLVKNRLVIDWTILGIGFGRMAMSGKIQAVNAPEEFDLRAFPAAAGQGKFGFEDYFPLNKKTEAHSISLSGKAFMPMLRTSLSIGIAY